MMELWKHLLRVGLSNEDCARIYRMLEPYHLKPISEVEHISIIWPVKKTRICVRDVKGKVYVNIEMTGDE